jgi:hypothetical protein
MSRRFCYVLTLGAIMLSTTRVVAQNQTQTATDPTLATLQLQQQQLAAQQAILDAKLKIQQDQQALLTGMLPASTTTPNSGAFTVSGNTPFPSQKLAYDELVNIAKQIVSKITVAGPIVVYDQTEINSLVTYKASYKLLKALQTQVQGLKKEFDSDLHPRAADLLRLQPSIQPTKFAGILAPGLVLAGLKTVSDIIGMFRTNTAIAYSTFTSDDAALSAAVAEALVGAGKTVYQPAVTPLKLTDDTSAFMDLWSGVQATLATVTYQASLDQARLQQVSDALGAYIQADQVSQANQDQISAEKDAAKRASLELKQKSLDRMREVARQYVLNLLSAPTASLDPAAANVMKAERDAFLKVLAGFATSTSTVATAFGAVQTALTAISSTGPVTLAAILRAEKLMSVAAGENASILLVKTSVLGGSVVTRTNLFTGGHLLFTGGAIANFTLFDAAGAIKASGLVVGNSGRHEEKY